MLLAIDTSGSQLALGLFETTEDRRPLREHREDAGRGQAERLVPAIRRLLDESNASPSRLSLIAVVAGPGSFMGLRVGLAAARAMALGLGIEAIGVSRMQALARGHGETHVVLDARREQVFEQAFDAANEAISPLRATAIDEFEPACEALAGSGVSLLAPGGGYRPRFTHDMPDLAAVAAVALDHPLPARAIYGRGADAKPQRPATIKAANVR